jgi:hypothetical protein
MKWAILLHYYQPYGQKREIVDKIVAQCYRPVAEAILEAPRACVSINFTGVLLDLLEEHGHREVIEMYKQAALEGKVELVGSAKYHAILPLLPQSEVRRQLEINTETNRKYFGDAYTGRGLFLPEEAWSPELAPVIEAAGFEWAILDELAYNGHIGEVDYTKTYQLEGGKLGVVFREHRLSSMVASIARDASKLKQAVREELGKDRYVVAAMDGEVFGHHQIGHERLLRSMMKDPEIELVRMSEVFKLYPVTKKVKTVACTWASSEDDIAKGIQFISWNDPENEIHKLQWELLNLTVEQMEAAPKTAPGYASMRAKLDWALGSDQFFWAAGKPWWMIEYIERGAYDLLSLLQQLPNVGSQLAGYALDLYHQILALAYEWQRSGKIDSADQRPRVPFKEQTLDKGGEAEWRAFLDMMSEEEAKAAKRGDYEEAILWRNGRFKLEHKHDIYDAIYVIDLLRRKLPKGLVEDTIKSYREQYSRIRGGQVEQRSN